jgi:hypothetical protein
VESKLEKKKLIQRKFEPLGKKILEIDASCLVITVISNYNLHSWGIQAKNRTSQHITLMQIHPQAQYNNPNNVPSKIIYIYSYFFYILLYFKLYNKYLFIFYINHIM